MVAGLDLALALWLVAWQAWYLCAQQLAPADQPWLPPWQASVGSGAPGGRSAKAKRNPYPNPVTAADIMARRQLILLWIRERSIPESDAPEVAAAVIDGAWKARDRYDPTRAEFDSWLYAITFRQACTYLRSARVRRERLVDISNRIDLESLDPEEAAERAQLYRRALEILTRLPAHIAAAFIGCHVDFSCTREYAEAAGLPVGTVWSWLRRARTLIACELRREEAIDAHALAFRRRRKGSAAPGADQRDARDVEAAQTEGVESGAHP